MQKNDIVEFSKILYGLAENFSATLTDAGIDIRYEALKNYTIDQVRAAAIQIAQTRRYTTMPTVADFVDAIDGSRDDRAEIQATDVLDKIRRVGSYGTPSFADPITSDLVFRRFGWGALCQKKEADTQFFVRDFKAAYLSYSREGARLGLALEAPAEVKRLVANIGSCEQQGMGE